MESRRLLQLLTFLLAFTLGGKATAAAHPDGAASAMVSRNILSPPRQSLPTPVHDEATCAFCQAAAFAPHTARAADTLAIAAENEQPVLLAHEVRPPASGSARPPRSRAPPASRSV